MSDSPTLNVRGDDLERASPPAKPAEVAAAARFGRRLAVSVLALGCAAFLLVLVGALAYFWWLPAIAESLVLERLDGVAEKLDVEISIGAVDLVGGSHVVVRDFRAYRKDPELAALDDRPLLIAPEIDVELDVLSAFSDPEVGRIVVSSPQLVVVRGPDGASDIDPVIEAIDARLSNEGGGADDVGGRALPEVRIQGATAEIVDRCRACGSSSPPVGSNGRVATALRGLRWPVSKVSGGQLTASFPPTGVTGAGLRLRGAAKVVSGGTERMVDVTAERVAEGSPLSLSADFEPPLDVAHVPRAEFLHAKVGGIAVEGNEVSAGGVRIGLGPHEIFDAEQVTATLSELSLDLASVRLERVSFVRPELDVMLAGGTNTLSLVEDWLADPPGRHVVATAKRMAGGTAAEPKMATATSARVESYTPNRTLLEKGVLRIRTDAAGEARTFRMDDVEATIEHVRADGTLQGKATFVPGGGKQVEVNGHWRYRERTIAIDSEFDAVPVADIVQHFGFERGDILKRGRVTGAVSVRHTSGEAWTLDAKLDAETVSIDHPKIALSPVDDLDFHLSGKASWNPASGDLVVSDGVFMLEHAATVAFNAGVYGLGHGDPKAPIDLVRVDLDVKMKPTSAQSIYEAVPFALRDRLEGLTLKGKVGFRFSADVDATRIAKMKTRSKVKLVDFDIVDYSPDAYVPKLLGYFVHEGVQPETDYEYFIEADGPGWVSIRNVSPYVIKAILTNEDGSFYSHDGFSWRQMKSSLQENLEAGRYVRGASTVSMQLVKNVFLSHERTLSRKLQEAFLVFVMEEVVDVPKDRILEVYLNVIEWGPNVYGIRSAARHYFGRRPVDLTLSESVFLISIIPGPRKYHSYYRRGEISDSWWRRIQRLLWAMQDREHITQAEYQRAMNDRPVFWYGEGFRPIEERRPVVPILEP